MMCPMRSGDLWPPGFCALRATIASSGPKEANHPHDVLPANRTFVQHFAAWRARGHVTALQHYALNGRVHADLAQVIDGQFVDGCFRLKMGKEK